MRPSPHDGVCSIKEVQTRTLTVGGSVQSLPNTRVRSSLRHCTTRKSFSDSSTAGTTPQPWNERSRIENHKILRILGVFLPSPPSEPEPRRSSRQLWRRPSIDFHRLRPVEQKQRGRSPSRGSVSFCTPSVHKMSEICWRMIQDSLLRVMGLGIRRRQLLRSLALGRRSKLTRTDAVFSQTASVRSKLPPIDPPPQGPMPKINAANSVLSAR